MDYESELHRLHMELMQAEQGNSFQRPSEVDYKLFEEHRPEKHELGEPCAKCGEPWPCKGIRILEQWRG